MDCNYCNKKTKLVSGKRIYPHRPDLKTKQFWLCEPCNAYVGCHGNTDKPLGNLANKELRQLRLKVHSLFDPVWLHEKRIRRKEAYKWLAVKLNMPYEKCHIGMFNIETCKKALGIFSQDGG